jgi:large subunit ribosomal protein L30
MGLLAIVRIKGTVKANKEIKDTLYLLRLRRNNYAVIMKDTKDIRGMIKKVEPWVAWGEIDKETLKELLLKRGRLEGNKRLTEDYIKQTLNMDIDTLVEKLINNEIDLDLIPKIKKIFRLKPPSKGYPRKGIKVPYSQGGAYGYYGKDINILLKKMI